MEKRRFLAVMASAIGAALFGRQARAEKKEPEKSPHAAALELVFRKAAARIREIDKNDWWHDTEERTWVAKRPFSPGVINSMSWFEVSYKIAGKEVAKWSVDTAKETVEEWTEAERNPTK